MVLPSLLGFDEIAAVVDELYEGVLKVRIVGGIVLDDFLELVRHDDQFGVNDVVPQSVRDDVVKFHLLPEQKYEGTYKIYSKLDVSDSDKH